MDVLVTLEAANTPPTNVDIIMENSETEAINDQATSFWCWSRTQLCICSLTLERAEISIADLTVNYTEEGEEISVNALIVINTTGNICKNFRTSRLRLMSSNVPTALSRRL